MFKIFRAILSRCICLVPAISKSAARVNSAEMNLGGSGKINGEQLKASSVKVTVDGSGEANVYASEQLDADLSGSGSIRYSGNPAKIYQKDNGSGSITSE